ncbi:MAG: anion permease, partial [Desulfobacterales bacterium]|nr:anion permease [Desulfobacterales bacterium]
MAGEKKQKVTGYDKYVDWKIFSVPVVLFFLILLLPTPYGMKDVGTEYRIGPKAVVGHITQRLFEEKSTEVDQWQLLTARMMEQNLQMGALSKNRFMERDMGWCKKYDIPVDAHNFKKAKVFIENEVPKEAFASLMQSALDLRKDKLKYENLSPAEKKKADEAAWQIKVAIAMAVFVIICFFTECIPLPGVAFCIGLILVFGGVVTKKNVAMLYWDDACWFIMGSLMFAAAFVKTGVDKRMCLLMFRKLARPNVKWITLIF